MTDGYKVKKIFLGEDLVWPPATIMTYTLPAGTSSISIYQDGKTIQSVTVEGDGAINMVNGWADAGLGQLYKDDNNFAMLYAYPGWSNVNYYNAAGYLCFGINGTRTDIVTIPSSYAATFNYKIVYTRDTVEFTYNSYTQTITYNATQKSFIEGLFDSSVTTLKQGGTNSTRPSATVTVAYS